MTDGPTDGSRPTPGAGGVALVVLAAGQGTRMRSARPKPLHPVAGLPMAAHVLRAGAAAEPTSTILVVGQDTADLADHLGVADRVVSVRQDPPRGTGDAVRVALAAAGDAAWLLVLFADHPLLTAETVARFVETARATRARVTVLSCLLPEAGAYGRVVRDRAGRPVAIVERKDDDPAARAGPTEINSGMMVLDAAWARSAVSRLAPSPATGEYYMTDLVAIAAEDRLPQGGWPVAALTAEPEVALGINDRAQLAEADALARERVRRRLMAAGVTLVMPETICVDEDVEVGQDTVILPHSVLLAGTVVGARCTVGPHAVLDTARLADDVLVRSSTVVRSAVAPGSDVGPYAHLRGGTMVGPGVHVGSYAELKNAELEEGVRVGHFSYLGDARVGAGTNIGAGTVTANFDGVNKYRTEIGPGAFIGSDSILRAPIRIGAGATTGAGSVVTKDVPDGATAVGVPARVVRRAKPSSGETEGGEAVGIGGQVDRAQEPVEAGGARGEGHG